MKNGKKIWKVMIAICLIGIILLENLYTYKTVTYANDTKKYIGSFNLYTYRADKYLEQNSVCRTVINNMMNASFPAQRIVDSLSKDNSFQKKVDAWKYIHYTDSPSKLADDVMKEKDLYSAIIISVFVSEATNDNNIMDYTKLISKETSDVISSVKKSISINETQNLTDFSKNDLENILEKASKTFENNHPKLDALSDYSENISDLFEAGGTLVEAIQRMAEYTQICELSVEIKNVLQDMYNNCQSDNGQLKSALSEVIESMRSFDSGICANIMNVTEKTLFDIVGTILDECWKDFLKDMPVVYYFCVGADIGIKFGDIMCTHLFSTDKTIEQYEKMRCLSEFTCLLKSSIQHMEKEYVKNRTSDNARNYFASIDALFSIAELSCKYAVEYADIIYTDSLIGNVKYLFSKKSRENCDSFISAINDIERSYNSESQSLINNYLNGLDAEHHDIYNILMGESDPVGVTGISFVNKDITIGIKDEYIYSAGIVEVEPKNATNKILSYSSSDESICGVENSAGWLIPRKAGDVTITASSVDGNYTDSVHVHVIDGYSDAWQDMGMFNCVSSGNCGDNVSWQLWSNGRLLINGEGNMTDYGYNESPWYNNTFINFVEIGSGVKSIGDCAFSGCTNLQNIYFIGSPEKIGKSAFYNTGLMDVSLPDGMKSIDNYAFANCKNLKSIQIADSVDTMGLAVFLNCKSLEKITLSKKMNCITQGLFMNCTKLSEISITDNIIEIDDNAFYKCSSLEKVEIYNDNVDIWDDAFTNCESKLILYGNAGSNAETFAKNHGISFVAFDDIDRDLYVKDFTFDNSNTYKTFEKINIVGQAAGGTAPYQYKFYYIIDGIRHSIRDYTSSGTTSFIPMKGGIYSFGVEVKDDNGKIASKQINEIRVKGFEGFAGGDGTKNNPYQISNVQMFEEIENRQNDNYILINDIDLSCAPRISKFNGTLDGQGYTIRCTFSQNNGLFNYLSESSYIQNCNVVIIDNHNSFPEQFGSIAIENYGTIEGCISQGDIAVVGCGNDWFCYGGICSFNRGTVKRCRNDLNFALKDCSSGFKGAAWIGGICGQGGADKCLNTGNISVDVYYLGTYSVNAGGINAVEVSNNCANVGNVSVKCLADSYFSEAHVGAINGAAAHYYDTIMKEYGKNNMVSNDAKFNLDVEFTNVNYEIVHSSKIYESSEIEGIAVKSKDYIMNWWDEKVIGDNATDICNKIKNAKEGDSITLKLKNGILDKKIANALVDKNVNLLIDMQNGLKWSINGKNVKENINQNINLNVLRSDVRISDISIDNAQKIIGNRTVEQIIFSENGALKFDSTLMVSGVKDNVNKVVQVDIGSMVYTDAEVVKSNTFTINITNRENRLLIYGINGDLNSDSKIDIRDAMSCLRHVSGREDLDCVREGFADVNFDEKVNIQDLIKEIHVVSGREDNF